MLSVWFSSCTEVEDSDQNHTDNHWLLSALHNLHLQLPPSQQGQKHSKEQNPACCFTSLTVIYPLAGVPGPNRPQQTDSGTVSFPELPPVELKFIHLTIIFYQSYLSVYIIYILQNALLKCFFQKYNCV